MVDMIANPTSDALSSSLDFLQEDIVSKSYVNCSWYLVFLFEGIELRWVPWETTDDQASLCCR